MQLHRYIEAKVDNAEFQGTILELRKELSRVKVKYQRAAARCTKLEAMYYTLKDARDASDAGGSFAGGRGGNAMPV
jgi:hypothetical protein